MNHNLKYLAGYSIAILLCCFCETSFSASNYKCNLPGLCPNKIATISSTSTTPSQQKCVQLGAVYSATAGAREQGSTPKEALNYIGSLYPASNDKPQMNAERLQLSTKSVKQIINLVYFDPAFRDAGGDALQMQIYQICMGTYRPMEPLR